MNCGIELFLFFADGNVLGCKTSEKKQLMGDAALAAPVLGSYPQPLG